MKNLLKTTVCFTTMSLTAILLPMNVIISYFVFVIIAAFTTFDYVWIMTQGGPAGSTEVFATRIYKTTFINYDAGYGAAMSLSVCILALSVYFVLKFIQKRGRE